MEKTAGTSALKRGEKFTLEQWRSWPENERWELIGGTAFSMSPAPRVPHQDFAGSFYRKIGSFLDDKPCRPFMAPVDVFLPDGVADSADTVVQPDVMVVCDPIKIEDNGIHGAPDFIVEVLSESTAYRDWNDKKALYERAGVKEYWIVSPDTGSVFRYVLSEGRYGPVTEILRGEAAESISFQGFSWTAPPDKR
ncbi:MAG: Uma2 family endonuclease [Treponemataceae bacterium]